MSIPANSKNKSYSVFLVVLINLLAVVLIIAGLEFWAAKYAEPPRRHIVKSFQFNHTWKPNGKKVHDEWGWRNPDFSKPYTHQYNAQGWVENYDIEINKPDNVYRIFFIGDSHTEGTVPMDKSVASVVETHLNSVAEERGLDSRVEVINTGTSSYSPTIFYVLFRYVILDYSPDLIVVNLSMNDDFDDWKYRETLIVDDQGNPLAVPPRNIYESAYFEGKESVVRGLIELV